MDRTRKISIIPFPRYSHGRLIPLEGRVVKGHSVNGYRQRKSVFLHMWQILRLLTRPAFANKPICVHVGPRVYTTHTDRWGHYKLEVEKNKNNHSPVVMSAANEYNTFSLNDVSFRYNPAQINKIIVSDIDDTVIRSHAYNFLKLCMTTLFVKSSRRRSFDATPELYQKTAQNFVASNGSNRKNLLIFLSNSDWRLYPYLRFLLKSLGFPAAPLILNNSSNRCRQKTVQNSHKYQQLKKINETFPHHPLVLIGDDGQEDLEVYSSFLEKHPRKIERILIRNIKNKKMPEPLKENKKVIHFQQSDELLNRYHELFKINSFKIPHRSTIGNV